MAQKALILTPSKGFGELIRQVLADGSSLDPILVSSIKQAIDAARKEAVDLLVVDADLGVANLAATVAELRILAPGLHLIVAPAEENPTDPQLATLAADAILPSPFYLPNLVAAIEQLYGPLRAKEGPKRSRFGNAPTQFKTSPHEEAAAPEWLQDVDLVAQYLTRLSLESASQAALITRREKVWAYAGELPQGAAEELADAVSQHSARDGADLARFIHLNATKADYMLYATALGGEYSLALVFDAQVPFSQMRAQVNQIASALASAPQQELVKGAMSEARRIVNVRLQEGEMGKGVEPAERMPAGGASMRSSEIPSARPAPVSGQTGRLEPLSAGSYDLHYTYVLIPRLPTHLLEGDLAERLAQWLPQLCLAFAWRLESLSVNPDFLQWVVSAPPKTTPEIVAQTMEKHLSERIFEEFPRLKRENPSGQFFAPGFLIVTGASPSNDVISEYIQQTRARQGIPNRN